ncbi:MAG: hypothetical protein DIZ80_14695 [endosymbiont of Galathealinum brachiosum]|uniref:Tetratricopeptide repeat protein n=1 Tax=endosymbiont of Galathealinum brachiosum TaxID=2200906 RepID=A0A370D8X2_9GAMM|nr:MAG: hypothetical protein DIZ80_14695 [endosymbiont of Galathealinum brachiosum]
MSYIKAVYLDLNRCNEDFIKGIELLERCSLSDAVELFQRACQSISVDHELFSKYHSFYGFSCLLNGKHEAIKICRNAVRSYPFDGDICMNLARAEIILNNRSAALDVIRTGLRYSENHEGLQKLKVKLGVRKRKPIPFISRNNPVSVALGKRMRKLR